MKHENRYKILTTLLLMTAFGVATQAAIIVNTSPGTGAPPGTLGGYAMTAFPADPTSEGTMISSLAPPPSAPVTGNLTFSRPVEHDVVGSLWDTWSHGYKGDVYYTDANSLMMNLPDSTLAFYLYVEPNRKYTFEFKADSMATVTTLDIDGNAGARFVGFYTDDPTDPLAWVYVRQTTMDSDGFAVGEFGINEVPEPSTCLAGILVLGVLGFARSMRRK